MSEVRQRIPMEVRLGLGNFLDCSVSEFDNEAEWLSEGAFGAFKREPLRQIATEYFDWVFSEPRTDRELLEIWLSGPSEFLPRDNDVLRQFFLLLHEKLKSRPHSKRYLALAAKPHLKRGQEANKGKKA